MPFLNDAQAEHPAFEPGVERLRQCGITVRYGGDKPAAHPPGAGRVRAASFPRDTALAAVN